MLARKIHVGSNMANLYGPSFDLLYKYGQSGATRRSSQREYITISSITYSSLEYGVIKYCNVIGQCLDSKSQRNKNVKRCRDGMPKSIQTR